MFVSELYIYPVKSLGGVSVRSAGVTDRGLQHDRRWMLVDNSGRFISQRTLPEMALLQPAVEDHRLVIRHKQIAAPPLVIPFPQEQDDVHTVSVFADQCAAIYAGSEATEWLSELLSVHCSLVYMPEGSKRRVDPEYAQQGEITSFSDGYPFMMLGQASLDDLNTRLAEPLPTNRFRPNIVFSGGQPYQEDGFKEFRIAQVTFLGVKRCARCMIPTIDQENLFQGKEPLKTLAGYREENNKIYFGQNLVHRGEGSITVGDPLEVIRFS